MEVSRVLDCVLVYVGSANKGVAGVRGGDDPVSVPCAVLSSERIEPYRIKNKTT